MAWSRGLPNGTQESTPIVYRGVMYLYAPGASIQAVDATNGDLIWEYTRNYPRDLSVTAARNKSLGIFEDMIYFAAPDGFLVALDARTGKIRWSPSIQKPNGFWMGPEGPRRPKRPGSPHSLAEALPAPGAKNRVGPNGPQAFANYVENPRAISFANYMEF
jgi:PQQ-like domain